MTKYLVAPFKTLFSAPSLLFLYTLFGGLLTFLLLRVFAHWTGDVPTWPILGGALLLGGLLAWILNRFAARFIGIRVCSFLALVVALIFCYALANTAGVVEAWRLLCWRNDLSYELWQSFVLRHALLWFVPGLILLPILFARNSQPRGKLTLFCGVCCGVILGRLFVGHLPTTPLLDLCLYGLLLTSLVLIFIHCRALWSRCIIGCFLILLGTTYYLGTVRSAQDLLMDFHPFAYIAQRDSRYIGNPTGFTIKEGRILRVDRLDKASLVASQALPLLFRPAPNARISARTQVGTAAFEQYETSELKGRYDALWVELPPAWLAEEQDYFGASALNIIHEHLQEDGILVYDMDARALDETMLHIRATALKKHFEHLQLWMTGLNRWQFVASRKPLVATLDIADHLIDREEVIVPLRKVNIPTPLLLFPSCILSDCSVLEAEEGFRFMERRFGRKNLFDPAAGRRLIAATLPFYANDLLWVAMTTPAEKDLLNSLRKARKVALEGTLKTDPVEIVRAYQSASIVLAQDPFLLGLADHEYATARDWEALARYDHALKIYANTISYAQPDLATVLHAANLAHKHNDLPLAENLYRVAEDIAPESPLFLKSYINFLKETKRFKEAEQACLTLLRIASVDSPEDLPMTRFYLGVCIAQQPNRLQEGVDVLKTFVRGLKTPEEKDAYIPAYGQFLIDMGRLKEGLEIRRYYQEHKTLKPETTGGK